MEEALGCSTCKGMRMLREVDCDIILIKASVDLPGTLAWGQLFVNEARGLETALHQMSPQEGL